MSENFIYIQVVRGREVEARVFPQKFPRGLKLLSRMGRQNWGGVIRDYEVCHQPSDPDERLFFHTSMIINSRSLASPRLVCA